MSCRWLVWLSILFYCCGLTSQQIALVVNRQSPESIRLAQVYAAARGIPDGRIITIDVPNGNEIQFDQYEREVVPTIRDFLKQHQLTRQVRCLVTFYGVPFRIRDRVDTGAEKQELADLRQRQAKVIDEATPLVEQVERLTATLIPGYKVLPRTAEVTPMQYLGRRYQEALRMSALRLVSTTQQSDRRAPTTELVPLISKLGGDADLVNYVGPISNGPATEPSATQQKWDDLRKVVDQAALDVGTAQQKRYDAASRALVLKIAAQHLGLIRLGSLLESQIDYLTPGLTNAAFDSELSLLWLNYYPRNGPMINPLYYGAFSNMRGQALMVSRLDGPDVMTVERMIQVSVQVEKEGLKGGLVVNSHGFDNGVSGDALEARTRFDHNLRNLAEIGAEHSSLIVRAEYSRFLTNREAEDTALYCGWYSLRNYIPGMKFSPGAVGYHVASLEMVSLHEPGETGWVRGLLTDGCAATLGPVAEPYLAAFPLPTEFFPLLMTGKLTLAEVYWRTEPYASWMICLIGDPLYTPYRVNPAMKAEDLPQQLRRLVTPLPVTRYSSSRPQ